MRIKLFLSQDEYNGLVEAALKSVRSVPDQAHYYIRAGLEAEGSQNDTAIESERGDARHAVEGAR
jgi:hypothetical protein